MPKELKSFITDGGAFYVVSDTGHKDYVGKVESFSDKLWWLFLTMLDLFGFVLRVSENKEE